MEGRGPLSSKSWSPRTASLRGCLKQFAIAYLPRPPTTEPRCPNHLSNTPRPNPTEKKKILLESARGALPVARRGAAARVGGRGAGQVGSPRGGRASRGEGPAGSRRPSTRTAGPGSVRQGPAALFPALGACSKGISLREKRAGVVGCRRLHGRGRGS